MRCNWCTIRHGKLGRLTRSVLLLDLRPAYRSDKNGGILLSSILFDLQGISIPTDYEIYTYLYYIYRKQERKTFSLSFGI